MVGLLVREVIESTGGTLCKGSAAFQFSKVSIDTRTLQKGDVYVAIKGARFDGHVFIRQAVEKGAAGIIAEHIPADVPETIAFAIRVTDSLKALQQMAHLYRKKFSIPLVAITGSYGKTTTKELTRAVLSEVYETFVTPGNFNNHIGLPLSLLRLEKKHEAAVLELGTSARGEITTLARIAEPTIGVITGIGQSHLEHLKTVENVFRAKMELLDNLSEQGVAILNSDDVFLAKAMTALPVPFISFGIKNEAHLLARAIEIDYKKQCIRFDISYQGETLPACVPVLGAHNVYNALAAAAVGVTLGIPLSKIAKGLGKFRPLGGRMRTLVYKGALVLDDCYNANPDSMQAALAVVKDFVPAARKVVVIGDMLELGAVSGQRHEEVGKKIGQMEIDMLYTIGSQAPIVGKAAHKNGLSLEKMRIFESSELELLVDDLLNFVKKGDVVLIKGSHGLHLEKIVEKMEK